MVEKGVTFHKGSATEIQLLRQNCCTALALLKFLGKGSLRGRTLFQKGFSPQILRFGVMVSPNATFITAKSRALWLR